MISIQAAVLREPGRPLKSERLEMEEPRPDEVLVRLVASGICKGLFPFDRLVKFYRFTEINRAIADSRRENTIKPVLRIWAGPTTATGCARASTRR